MEIKLGQLLLQIDLASLKQTNLETLDDIVIPFQAKLKGIHSSVFISGLVSRGDLIDLLSAFEKLQSNILASVRWELHDPMLLIIMKGEKTGQIEMKCDVSMDEMTEQHKFVMRIDQSYLSQAISSLRSGLSQ